MEENLKNTKSLFNYFIPLILVVPKYFKLKSARKNLCDENEKEKYIHQSNWFF